MNPDWSIERRDELLGAVRKIAEKARAEHRELTDAEGDEINATVDEARKINERHAADAKHRGIMSQLNEMAASSGVLSADGRRLSFGTSMASDAVSKIMPAGSYGQKAVAPSGATVVAQGFASDPVALGQPPTSLLSVLPV
jgi:hypothetical protein